MCAHFPAFLCFALQGRAPAVWLYFASSCLLMDSVLRRFVVFCCCLHSRTMFFAQRKDAAVLLWAHRSNAVVVLRSAFERVDATPFCCPPATAAAILPFACSRRGAHPFVPGCPVGLSVFFAVRAVRRYVRRLCSAARCAALRSNGRQRDCCLLPLRNASPVAHAHHPLPLFFFAAMRRTPSPSCARPCRCPCPRSPCLPRARWRGTSPLSTAPCTSPNRAATRSAVRAGRGARLHACRSGLASGSRSGFDESGRRRAMFCCRSCLRVVVRLVALL